MATSIRIRFLTGRAHLHPWHAAPNEGRVEWPPSPWRILRALVAVAGRGLTTLPDPGHQGVIADDWFKYSPPVTRRRFAKQSAPADPFWNERCDLLPFRTLSSLLDKLSTPPVVWLPRTGIGHTRHFFRTRSGASTGSAVFDTFAAMDVEEPLVFDWPDVTLVENDEQQLKRLLCRLLYFGRSESWCDAELERVHFEPGDTHWPCVAVQDDAAFTRYFRREALREYRNYTVEKRLAWDPGQAAFLRDQFKAAESDEPELLVRALLQQTGESMKHGDRPWGTRWLHYAVRREVFRLPARRAIRGMRATEDELQPLAECQVFRYAINTSTVHRAALPPLTATLAIAQRTRAAAMSIFGRQNDGLCSPQLAGKRFREDERRIELFAESDDDQITKFGNGNGTHSAHAYWWPVDEDGDGFLDHLVVLCRDGFSVRDVAALRALSRVGQGGSRAALLLTPVFEGKWEDCPGALSASRDSTCDFVSATPYFCPVHLTRRSGRRRSLKEQIDESLAKSELPAADRIDEIVFDYDLSSLGGLGPHDHRQHLVAHVQRDLQGASGDVLVGHGGFVVASLNAPLAAATDIRDPRYPAACIRDPDDPAPLGISRGLFVARERRFVPALEFHRVRTAGDRAKGPGVMLRVRFGSSQPARPFAIGQFCHFGLGLFAPIVPQRR